MSKHACSDDLQPRNAEGFITPQPNEFVHQDAKQRGGRQVDFESHVPVKKLFLSGVRGRGTYLLPIAARSPTLPVRR